MRYQFAQSQFQNVIEEFYQLVPTIYVLSKNKKNIKIFLMKFSIFKADKNHCILHGHVFVMRILSACATWSTKLRIQKSYNP